MAQRLWLLRSAVGNKLSPAPALRRRPPHTVTSSNHHPLLLSLGVPRRAFSEAAAAATLNNSNSNESTAVSPPPKLPQKMKKIPTRHSLHQPPAIPQTLEFLTHVTQELTGAAPGSLFLASSTDDPQVKWWDAHYDLLEQTSFALRGHASYIPGSLYYKQSSSTSKTSNAAPEQQHHLMQMQAILTKLMDDGELYMQVQHQKRLQQQKQQEEELQQQSASENVQEQEEQELSGNSSSEEESSSSSSSSSDEDGEHLRYEECPPGPSIVHYDIYLDALSAALPNNMHDDDDLDNTIIISPNDIVDILESVLERHELDGGDLHNVNPHTIPTQQTFNAALRAIANIPYNNSDNSSNERLRDEALQAFGIFNHLEHSPLLECNAASFCYMLQIVNKYIPTSRTKGNISMALWMQATKKGVVDASVVHAFQQCHSPSNGPEFEHVVQERTTSVSELPTRWIKRAKAKRFVKTSTRY